MAGNNNQLAMHLQSAEGDLRQAIALAAKDGSYALAQALSGIAGELGGAIRSLPGTIEEPQGQMHGAAKSRTERNGIQENAKSKPSIKRTRRAKRSKKSRAYPKYQIVGTTLVRLGWSKKTREEYSHKVPRSAYDQVSAAIDRVVSNGKKVFTADDVAAVLASEDCEHVPSYQMYIVIGYLKDNDALMAESRGKYKSEQPIGEFASSVWERNESS